MEEQRMIDEAELLDARIGEALEAKPEVEIPAGFAARVAGRLPSRSVVLLTPARYGLLVMRIAMAVLTVAIVVMAMRGIARTTVGVSLEWMLCAELVGIGMWLGGLRWVRTGEE
jgi:hypothetical protein